MRNIDRLDGISESRGCSKLIDRIFSHRGQNSTQRMELTVNQNGDLRSIVAPPPVGKDRKSGGNNQASCTDVNKSIPTEFSRIFFKTLRDRKVVNHF